MKELIELIVKGIVDKPDEVEINQIIGEKTLVFEIKANPQDVGKIIGKQGRNVKSIRTIANAAAQNSNKRVIIEIID